MKLSGHSGNFPDSLETVWTVWKLFGKSGKCTDGVKPLFEVDIDWNGALWLLGLTIFLADPWTGSLGAENAGISRLGSASFTLQKWRTETNLELQDCIFLINHKKI